MPLSRYTAAELTTHQTLVAAQHDTTQHGSETSGQINSRLQAAAEQLRQHSSDVAQRIVRQQALDYAAGTLTSGGIQQENG